MESNNYQRSTNAELIFSANKLILKVIEKNLSLNNTNIRNGYCCDFSL